MLDSYDNESLPPNVYSSPTCPPLALLRAWQQQVLPIDLASDVALHVESCTLCPTLLHDLEHLAPFTISSTERTRIRRKLPLPTPPGRLAEWRWYAIAAAVIALVIAGAFLAVHETEHPEEAHTIPLLFFTQPVQPHTGEPSGATPLTSPNNSSLIAKLAPPENLTSSAVKHRDQTDALEPSPQQLGPAFDAYIHSNYSLAIQRFSQLAKQFPRSGTPFLYLGVTQLLMNENTDALFNLTRAEQFVSPDQKDTATWYRAIAARRANAANASQLLHSICERKESSYAQQACQLEKHP